MKKKPPSSPTPFEAYQIIVKKAKKQGISPAKYMKNHGMGRYILSKWKKKTTGTIHLDLAIKLGVV